MSGTPDLLTVPEVCEQLKLSKVTLYKLMKAGVLPSLKIGKARRIPRWAVDALIAAGLAAEVA